MKHVMGGALQERRGGWDWREWERDLLLTCQVLRLAPSSHPGRVEVFETVVGNTAVETRETGMDEVADVVWTMLQGLRLQPVAVKAGEVALSVQVYLDLMSRVSLAWVVVVEVDGRLC